MALIMKLQEKDDENTPSSSSAVCQEEKDELNALIADLKSKQETQSAIIAKFKAEEDMRNHANANLEVEADEKDAIIQKLESLKRKQIKIIDNLKAENGKKNAIIESLQLKKDQQSATNCANLKTELGRKDAVIDSIQLQKEKAITAKVNMQTQLDELKLINANLTAERDNQMTANSKITNLQTQFTNEIENQKAIIANLTAEQEKKYVGSSDSLFRQNPDVQLVFDVRRRPTPPVNLNLRYGDMTIVTYDKAIFNVGNCMDIKTGIFTVPVTGRYFLPWTGPNGEFIRRDGHSRLNTNNDGGRGGWDDEKGKTQIFVYFSKGDKVFFWALFRADLYPKQYEKFVGYFIHA